MSDQDESSNVVWNHATVTRERREVLNQHKGGVFWFTGLAGAGKSTLAHAVEEKCTKKAIVHMCMVTMCAMGSAQVYPFYIMIAKKISVE